MFANHRVSCPGFAGLPAVPVPAPSRRPPSGAEFHHHRPGCSAHANRPEDLRLALAFCVEDALRRQVEFVMDALASHPALL